MNGTATQGKKRLDKTRSVHACECMHIHMYIHISHVCVHTYRHTHISMQCVCTFNVLYSPFQQAWPTCRGIPITATTIVEWLSDMMHAVKNIISDLCMQRTFIIINVITKVEITPVSSLQTIQISLSHIR